MRVVRTALSSPVIAYFASPLPQVESTSRIPRHRFADLINGALACEGDPA